MRKLCVPNERLRAEGSCSIPSPRGRSFPRCPPIIPGRHHAKRSRYHANSLRERRWSTERRGGAVRVSRSDTCRCGFTLFVIYF
ncbi:hypothetical protein EYF80_059082 [Liparis tanakae]|uniref:Uncharacterized protein n=1 Tax=Liparis tanakae TaxID=230148 RepID=A0A4Z2EPD9_9TELE|nr:hypothetical protein EYF80_059082 [Liparis tanakae]